MQQIGTATRTDIPETYGFGWQTLQFQLDMSDEKSLLALGDLASGQGARSDRVSAILGEAYGLPDHTFDPDRLSLVDRVAALFAVSFKFGRWPARFICACSHCGAGNDLGVAPEEFDYRPARAYSIDHGPARMMQPNGHHERLLETGAALTAGTLTVSGKIPDDTVFDALGSAAPEFTSSLPYSCSNCNADSQFWFDPLGWIADHVSALLIEVHQLASAYGWSEPQILALSRARRQSYIRLVEQGQGV